MTITLAARPVRRAAAFIAAAGIALTGSLVATTPASAAPVPPTFTDIATNPFRAEIEALAEQGLANGWPNGDGTAQYRPMSTINRDTFAAMVFRLAGSPASYTPPAKSPFRDVRTSHVFYKEIAFLYDMGVTEGWKVSGGREFRPSMAVKRDVMATFLYRMTYYDDAYQGPKRSPFVDVPTSHVFYDEIAWLAEAEISEGWAASGGGREFRPTSAVKRDVFAAFIARIQQYWG